MQNIAIIGGSGAIGLALLGELRALHPSANIYSFSRKNRENTVPGISYSTINFEDEASLKEAAATASSQGPIDLVVITTGILHNEDVKPEKALRELAASGLEYLFKVNTIIPALLAKHLIPKMAFNNGGIFAVLSARAGSIADNEMGG